MNQCLFSAGRRPAEAYCYDRGCFFFSPEFCSRPYQNSGHTGGSFFFTRILFPTIPKFRTYRRMLFFHQSFVPDHTKIQDKQEGISFSPEFFSNHTKIKDIQEGLSFSPEFSSRPYQNSGHTGGSSVGTKPEQPNVCHDFADNILQSWSQLCRGDIFSDPQPIWWSNARLKTVTVGAIEWEILCLKYRWCGMSWGVRSSLFVDCLWLVGVALKVCGFPPMYEGSTCCLLAFLYRGCVRCVSFQVCFSHCCRKKGVW